MEWGGKLVGGAVGMLVAGPVGAALGVLAGHLVDDKFAKPPASRQPRKPPRSREPAPRSSSRPSSRQDDRAGRSTLHHVEDTDPFADGMIDGGETEYEFEDSPAVENPAAVAEQFFQAVFEVMGHIAKCDGRVSESDIRAARAVMTDFALDEPQIARAIAFFNAGKQAGYDVERAVMALRRSCAGRPDLLRTFLEIEVRVAIGGSDLQGPARPLLTRVAAMLGVGGLEFAQLETVLRIRYRARGNRGGAADWNRPAEGAADAGAAETNNRANTARDRREQRGGARARTEQGANGAAPRMTLQEAYQVLGVMPGESMDAIRRAYRRQLSRHHPDKLQANGLPESMLTFAQQQTQLIIEAFSMIRESRGEPS